MTHRKMKSSKDTTMKRLLILLALCCAPMCAQSTSPITVTVKTGTIQKIWQFILGSPTSISGFTCTQPADVQPFEQVSQEPCQGAEN